MPGFLYALAARLAYPARQCIALVSDQDLTLLIKELVTAVQYRLPVKIIVFKDPQQTVDLTGMAKVRWITRASGFHVVRPVVKLADGTYLVGEHADANTSGFLETEFMFATQRWMKLDIERVVTKGTYGPAQDASAWTRDPVDLSKVDEVGFADLIPGSGHGSGGYVNVASFEVYGKPVKR